jgi:hypothetical protein
MIWAAHGRQLEESSIAPEIATERGYETVTSRTELLAFKGYQRRTPAFRIPLYSPDGITRSYQIRPDNPRQGKPREGKPRKLIKYETPGDSNVILDVHPRMRDEVRGGGSDLWITEGVKKADSLTSRGLPTVGLIGVWNWQRGGELLPCWDHVQLDGRRVCVVFDSDVMTKPEVQLALERLVAALEGRGADIQVIYLPDGEDGEDSKKIGVDDYLAAGGTVSEMKMLARKFKPEDLGRIRLSRDDKLRALIEDLERRLWAVEWKGMGGHSARDAFRVLVEAAASSGKPCKDGVRVRISRRTLQERASIGSAQTLGKAIARLEEWGLLYRDNEGREVDKTGAFVLHAKQIGGRAKVIQVGSTTREEKRTREGECDPGVTPLRAPRLRWSDPGREVQRSLIPGTKRVHSVDLPARPAHRRLGKIRGAVIDTLDAAGGSLRLSQLDDILKPTPRAPGKRRPRDLRRRQLPMLEQAGIITVAQHEEDQGKGSAVITTVSLTPDWQEQLHKAREIGDEIGAERLAREKHARQRKAYREQNDVKPDRHWANADADGYVEDLSDLEDSAPLPDSGPTLPERPEEPLSPLAEALGAYLDRNPRSATETPSWLGATLWAYDLVEGKPTPSDVEAALSSLKPRPVSTESSGGLGGRLREIRSTMRARRSARTSEQPNRPRSGETAHPPRASIPG